MTEFIKSNKLLVVTLILVVCGLFFYKVFFLSGDATPSLSSTTSATDAAFSPASQNLLVVLANLRTIQLNNAIFSSPAFASLTDFGVTIAPEPVGRVNPFAPYVGISLSSASTTSMTILTLPLGKKK